MSRTRIIVNMIDADGCTFNANYRQRLVYCIKHYGHIIDSYANKESLSSADKEVLEFFIRNKILKDQLNFKISKSEYQPLLAYCEERVKSVQWGDGLSTYRLKLSKFIYDYICKMEKICPDVLRHIYILSNSILIKNIKKQSADADQQILMLGSNRQCHVFDELNSKGKGTPSIYIELDELKKYINHTMTAKKIDLDKFTLADLYDNNMKGENCFKKILNGIFSGISNAFDDSKINIVYAAAHHVAKKYAGMQITINFWDDISSILKSINVFFSAHPELIPANIQLNLHRYDGKLKSSQTLTGSGVIDYNYKKNTLLMATMCGFDAARSENDAINIANSLDVPMFLQQRKTGWELSIYEGVQTLFNPLPSVETEQVAEFAEQRFF